MSRKARTLPSSTPDASSVPSANTAAARWRALFGSEPPRAALIDHAIAWQEQVDASSDVAPAIARDLAIAARQAREARGVVQPAPAAPPYAAPCSVSEQDVGSIPVNSYGPSRSICGQDRDEISEPSAAPCTISADVDATALTPRSAASRTRSREPATPLPPASSQLLPGTRLVKAHGGRNHVVQVTDTGFAYDGATYASLSAVAKHITGTHWNGLLFFGLRRRKTYPARVAANG